MFNLRCTALRVISVCDMLVILKALNKLRFKMI